MHAVYQPGVPIAELPEYLRRSRSPQLLFQEDNIRLSDSNGKPSQLLDLLPNPQDSYQQRSGHLLHRDQQLRGVQRKQ